MEGLQRPRNRILWKRSQQKQTLCLRSQDLSSPIRCSSCGTEFESAATTCPSCGKQVRKDRTKQLLAILIGFLAIGALFGPDPEPSRSASGSSDPSAPSASNIRTGNDVCAYIEATGNRQAGKSQRCAFRPDSVRGGSYTLTIRGDYEDDEMFVAIMLAREIAIRDGDAQLFSRQLTVSFPDSLSPMHGSSTATLEGLRACSESREEASERLCLIRLLTRLDN